MDPLQREVRQLTDHLEEEKAKLEQECAKRLRQIFIREIKDWRQRYAPNWRLAYSNSMGSSVVRLFKRRSEGAVRFETSFMPAPYTGNLLCHLERRCEGQSYFDRPMDERLRVPCLQELMWVINQFAPETHLWRQWEDFELSPAQKPARQ